MQQAWEYEKEGMGLQYNYGQPAADAVYRDWERYKFWSTKSRNGRCRTKRGLQRTNRQVGFSHECDGQSQ